MQRIQLFHVPTGANKSFWGLLAAVCALGATAEPVDGFYWAGSYWAPGYEFMSSAHYWREGVLPMDGGVGYFLTKESVDMAFNNAVTLRGLDFLNVKLTNGKPVISGSGLTLAGDAFISGTGRGSNTIGLDQFATITGTINGTGDNTFTKKGPGILQTGRCLTGFGTIAAGGGYLTTTATGPLYALDAPSFAVRGGVFRWAPSLAANAAGTASLGDATYGKGSGGIEWDRGAGASATLTINSLASEGPGSTLALMPSGGARSLGGAEKLMVTTPPALVNGMLDPAIVTCDSTVESWPISFTTYDAEKGVVPYPAESMVALADAAATDVAVLAETNTLAESKRVAALVVDNSASLEIASDTTLTVGDGDPAHTAGVIFNFQRPLSDDMAFTFAGGGTLDFGTSPGLVWMASPTLSGWGGNRRLFLATRITGSAGVTFAARHRGVASNSTGIFCLESVPGAWTGPTRVVGTILWVMGGGMLPAGDIYVEDGSGFGAQFRPQSAWTFNQNFFLAGRGPIGDGSCLVYLPNGTTRFNGVVTLTDDASFASTTSGQGLADFWNEVRGPGSLCVENGATFNFRAPNAFDSFVAAVGTTVNICSAGTFGTGRIWHKSGAHVINFQRPTSPLVVTNEFRQESGATLSLALDYAQVSLTKDVATTTTKLGNFSTLAVGGAFAADELKGTGSHDTTLGAEQITAAGPNGELRVGNGATTTCAVPLADGNGTLAFTKKGAGTVELPLAERTYSGSTTVAAGTLKLVDDPRFSSSLLYWLDASREEDITKDAETGVVSAWRSRGGTANVTFTKTAGSPVWGEQAKVNGLDVVSTDEAQLTADKSLEQRTVFIVYRMRNLKNMAGVFGGALNNGDYGVRTGSTTTGGWDANSSHYCFNTTGWIRRDGGRNGAVDQNVPHILTVMHDRDNWTPSVSWGANTVGCTFAAKLGYYQSLSRSFNGDYCEVLAFDRVLGESEIRIVENYLSEKWLNKTLWSDLAKPAHLPAGTALTVEKGATLDLAGNSLTVASLAGGGTITNSSETAATLTVADGGAFFGAVGGPTKLAVGGDATLGGSFGPNATLAVTGGSVAAGVQMLAPPTEGLAYWCDAGLKETILMNASGGVTGWVSRASSSAKSLVSTGTMQSGGSTTSRTTPVYSADAFGGRPCISFDTGSDALWADATSPVRTVFLAVWTKGAQTGNCAGIWGIGLRDVGIRFNPKTTRLNAGSGYVRPSGPDDWFYVDGTAVGQNEFDMGDGVPRVISMRLNEYPGSEARYDTFLGLGLENPTRVTLLGSYSGNPSFIGYVGEVIAYDRLLSDDEMRRVDAYLMTKWKTATWTEGAPPAETGAAFASGANLAVAGGATVDCGGADLTVQTLSSSTGASAGGLTHVGTLTVAEKLVIDVVNGRPVPLTLAGNVAFAPGATAEVDDWRTLSTDASRYDALTVTGTVTGDVKATLGGAWRWSRGAHGWIITKSGLTVILR